ncbi:hypothetical protein FHS72_001358 [Loktanella ponticola]|uniref:Transferrin-binding protein B C-lobe/N-lobe beta barrel domain-containing protein n=1 Tax=Yoonia ponticola TaxID=1524255 RepID=A0A7W9BJN3_9RHOB|nr:hypothetical protein [Yoonia ponticola]MBB5721746.1 hypothetical protein [Yoonia ponticola]
MKTMTLTALATVTLLSACGGSGSNPFDDVSEDFTAERGDVTANADGSYTIVDGGETIELAAGSVASSGVKTAVGGDLDITSFANDDVTLIGGYSGDLPFSGVIVGNAGNAPTGNATFTGGYTYITPDGTNTGDVILDFDLLDMDIESRDDNIFEVDGEVAADGTISGTVEYNDVETGFTGGFYGENTVGGAFDSETASGVFYGTK